MARRHRSKPREIAAPPSGATTAVTPAAAASDLFRRILLALVAAILVARPLVPSDGGAWAADGQVAAALWIALAALWVVQSLGRPRLVIRFRSVDAAMIAMTGWWATSAIRGISHAAPRPSINSLWEGVATLIAFLLLRQLVEPATDPPPTAALGEAGLKSNEPAAAARPWFSSKSGGESRAMIAVMISVGVVLAFTAIYQYFDAFPALRQRLLDNPAAAIREAQIDYAPPGTREFQRFADRVNSPEPTGTFGLTNSLAAFLAPWLVIAIGLAAFGWRDRPGAKRRDWIGPMICAVPIAIALALTRSRSAWIGAGIGLACIAIGWFRTAPKGGESGTTGKQSRRARGGLAAAIVVLCMAAAGTVIAVRPQLLQPATRSFQVRIDYWRATLRMIADRPWWGVGPGNFGDFYTRYSLPAAWEEIKDPHNFALELAASAGLPALLLFLVVLVGFARRVWRSESRPEPPGVAHDSSKSGATIEPAAPPASDGTLFVFGGALVGFWLAMAWNVIVGFPGAEDMTALQMLVAAASWWLLWPWVRGGNLSSRLLGIGVLVLLAALLAVGGLTFGGVNETLWLLLALGCNATEHAARFPFAKLFGRQRTGERFKLSLPWAANLPLLVIVGGLWWAQHRTGYEPALGCDSALDAARTFGAEGDMRNQEQQLLAAAEADPYAVEPRRQMAGLRLLEWLRGDEKGRRSNQFTSQMISEFEKWIDQALVLEPQSASLCVRAAEGWRIIYEITRVPADGRKAVELSRRAATLYPNGVLVQLELAETLAAIADGGGGSGRQSDNAAPSAAERKADRAAAKAAARDALELDDLRPETVRALDDEQRKLAQRIIAE